MKWTWIQLIKLIICYDLICDMLKKPGSVRLNTNPNAPGQVKLQVTEIMAGKIVAYQNLYLLHF